MTSSSKKHLLQHPLFLTSLTLLILNDAWLKWLFHNAVTGKLSDFSGLFAFSIVLFVFLPKKWEPYTCWISGGLFLLWKSPVATPVLAWVNQNPWLHFGRVLDYSDWWALLVLPLAHQLIKNRTPFGQRSSFHYLKDWQITSWKSTIHYLILAVSLFSFSATSLLRYEMPKGDIYIGESYKVKMPKDSLLAKLGQMGYTVNLDSVFQDTFTTRHIYDAPYLHYYQIESIALTAYDTLASLRFDLYPEKKGKHCRIEVINITLNQPGHMQNWRQLKRAWQFYRKSIKRNLIKKIE